MKKDYIIPKPDEDANTKGAQDFFKQPIEEGVKGVEDMLDKIDDILDEKQKLQPLTCCGRLVCKGRTPACFGCDICMDCITGAGCSHGESKHTPQSGYNL